MSSEHPKSSLYEALYKANKSHKQMIKTLLKQRNDFAKEVLELRWENAKLIAELNREE